MDNSIDMKNGIHSLLTYYGEGRENFNGHKKTEELART